MSKISGNLCLWVLTVFLNSLIGVSGLLLSVIGIIICFEVNKVSSLGVIIISIGLITLLSFINIISCSKRSSPMLIFVNVIQIILIGIFLSTSIYMLVDYKGLLDFACNNTQASDEEKETIRNLLEKYLDICQYTSYAIVGLLVR